MNTQQQPTTQQLKPDVQGAAQVETALQILHQGDDRVLQADRYLNDVRISPLAWPIVSALISNPSTTQPALLFAANTVFVRLRSDWLSFTNDAERLTAFTVAVDGACHIHLCKSTSLSPLHSFGKACGFALAIASNQSLRQSMWSLLMSRMSCDPVRKCHVLAAVANQFEETSTRNDTFYSIARAFCQQHVAHVIAEPVAILNACDPPLVRGDQSISNLCAAVTCIKAWSGFADKPLMAHVLLRALPIPQLADDVAETMSEIVGYSGTSHTLLLQVCDALITIFQLVSTTVACEVVQHAIAEIACMLVEGNADELMEQDAMESKLVAARVTQLLWLCLKSCNPRCFFAAVEGWTNWIAADGLVIDSRRVLHSDQLTAIVQLVVNRLAAMPVTAALVPWSEYGEDQGSDYCSEISRARDLLLTICSSVGIPSYTNSVVPFLQQDKASSGNLICAAMFALSIAGEAQDGLFEGDYACATTTAALGKVMDILEGLSREQSDMDMTICTNVRRQGMQCLGAFSFVVGAQCSDVDFQRVVRLAATGVYDSEVCLEAGKVMYEMSQQEANRLLPFLGELISSCTAAMERMSTRAACMWVCALARTASALRLHKERLEGLSRILRASCKHVRDVGRGNVVEEVEEGLCRHLTLISKAMHEMNDNVVRLHLFGGLRDVVAELSLKYCADGGISRAICRLLETCVLPTLMDEEESEDDRDGRDTRRDRLDAQMENEERRVELAMWCASLAAECFERCGAGGEMCWLQTVKDICPHLLSGLDGEISQETEEKVLQVVCRVLGTSVTVVTRNCGGDYDTRADMATCMLKLGSLVVTHGTSSKVVGRPEMCADMSRAALHGLRCRNANVVRESLTFWKRTFRGETDAVVWRRLLGAAGGAKMVTAGVLCAARVGRVGSAAADTVFGMCAVVAGAERRDAGEVLLQCLREAFAGDDVPRQGLDRRVKEMLFCGCVSSVRSKREFRRALDDLGRVCAMTM